MASSLFFAKRCGGTHWRCGYCGKDYEIDSPDSPAALRRKVRDTDQLAAFVPGAYELMIGNRLVSLICDECAKPVLAELGRLAPRSVVDVDDAGNLLGDF